MGRQLPDLLCGFLPPRVETVLKTLLKADEGGLGAVSGTKTSNLPRLLLFAGLRVEELKAFAETFGRLQQLILRKRRCLRVRPHLRNSCGNLAEE